MTQETSLNSIYIIISCVTLAAAILSPILTAWINNRYQLKMRTLELDHDDKQASTLHHRQIIEHYLMAAGASAYNYNGNTVSEYGKYYALAFSHLPEECHAQMKKLNEVIHYNNVNNSRAEFEKLALIVKDHIPK